MTDRQLVTLMAAIVDAGSRASGFREDVLTPKQSVEQALELFGAAEWVITRQKAGWTSPAR